MSEVQKLEKLLQEEKEKEKIIALNKELEEIKKEYEGKCFGSNLFNRMHKSRYFGAVYYEKFFIKENDIYVTEWILNGDRKPAFYRSETPTYNITTGIYERKLTGNRYNASYNLYGDYSFYRKPITKEEFMSLWTAARECYLIIRDTFKINPQVEIEDIRQGDHDKDKTIENIILELGLDVIDLQQYPKMFWIFEYKTLPMLQHGRWLPRIYAKQLLEYTVQNLEEEMKDPYATSKSKAYDLERITAINEFINLNL